MSFSAKVFTIFTAVLVLAFPAFCTEWSSLLPPDAVRPSANGVHRENRDIKVGDVATVPLPSSRSYSSHAEIEGDSVRVVSYDELSGMTLQGARPGRSTVRIFEKFWRDPDIRESYVLVEEIVFQVAGRKSNRLSDSPEQPGQAIPEPRQKGSMDWEGFISRQRDELLTVITDDKEWTSLWKTVFNRPAPRVDFEKYAVACVFLGYQADWLYDIHIGEPREDSNILSIPYGMNEIILELSGPFRATGQYRMKAVGKKKGCGMVLERQRDPGPR